ncbi:MAG: ComF family protein [Gammaproteobacteria bacterium]|jgi:ComF family protein|nr:ComF family protein [Gammaproteobacteria bacterium]MBT4491623.1 ComF family protein [Gammaproteobacteria bacterium]MBT7371250.1 ComF family protein [Gammaproteobacteria bacterium]
MGSLSFTLLPGCCVLCSAWTHRELDLCIACEQDLPWITEACCYCALPLSDSRDICSRCMQQAPDYSAALCPFEYRFPVDVMIQRFKESNHLASGRVLATLLAKQLCETLTQLCQDKTMIVPVPLHPSTQRRRGFNQSLVIAREISRSFATPIVESCLWRTKQTIDQKSLNLVDRRKNLAGVFTATKDVHRQRILLVDDVITTTATITEISQTLLAAGAEDVVVLALARTPSHYA